MSLLVCVLSSQVCLATRCSYSFVVKEVTSSNSCACDTQAAGASGEADMELASDASSDATAHTQTSSNDVTDSRHSEHVITLQNNVHASTDDSHDDVIAELRHQLRQLQQRQDLVYNKLKDVEIRFYKENVRNFHLETLIDRQDGVINNLRESLASVREAVSQTQHGVDELRRDTDREMRALQGKVDANADTLYKQSSYLEDIEQRQQGVASTSYSYLSFESESDR